MDTEPVLLISFVVATTFSPGPNNISSASMGILYGYKKTMNYLFGIVAGFYVVLMGCAYLSSSLLTVLPASEKYLRWIGAAYILWLALGILRSNTSFAQINGPPRAFAKGFFLQLVNPKAIIYGLTLFSTFLASISGQMNLLALYAALFAFVTFTAVSTWALFGAVIKTRLKNEGLRTGINRFLAVLLILTAVDLSGMFF